MAVRNETLSHLIKEVAADLSKLMRKEIELAREETAAIMKEKLRGAAGGAIALVLALLLLPFLVLTGLEVLAIFIPRWAATLGVTLTMAGAGVVLALFAKKKLAGKTLPTKTLETLKEDIEWARNLKR